MKQLVWAFTLAGASLLALGCSTAEDVADVKTSRQALSTSEVRLRFPAGSLGDVPLVSLDGSLSLDDRTKVRLPDGTPTGAVQLGAAQVTIGADTKVGGVITQGSVFLRSRANVAGAVVTAGTITKQDGVVISGQQTSSATLTPTNDETFPVPFASGTSDQNLEPDQQRELSPGQFGSLSVKSRARLKLKAGDYAFKSVTIEPQAILELDDGLGPVRLFVDNGFTFRGTVITKSGQPPAFLVVQLGTQPIAMLDASFHGTIMAPNAEVILGPGAQPHEGSFVGRSVLVRPDTVVVYRPYYRLEGVVAFTVPSSTFGPYGALGFDASGGMLAAAQNAPVSVADNGGVSPALTPAPYQRFSIDPKGQFFGRVTAGAFEVYEKSGALRYSQAREPAGFGTMIPGSERVLLPEVGNDPEKPHATHARIFGSSGMLYRFATPGLVASRVTETHLIYSTQTELVKVSLSGSEAWRVPLALTTFEIASDGSRLIGVQQKSSKVVHVNLSNGATESTTTLSGAFWNVAIAPAGAVSAATTQNRLYVFKGGSLVRDVSLPVTWAVSVAVSNDGNVIVGGQQQDHSTTLFLLGQPGTGAWKTNAGVERDAYRPGLSFSPVKKRFVVNGTAGLTAFDIRRSF